MLAEEGLKFRRHLIGIAKEGMDIFAFLGGDFSKGFLLQSLELVDHLLVHLKILRPILALIEERIAPHSLEGEHARHLEARIYQYALPTSEQFGVESAHRGTDNEVGIFRFHQVAQECDGLGRKYGKVGRNNLYAMRIKHLAQHHHRARRAG